MPVESYLRARQLLDHSNFGETEPLNLSLLNNPVFSMNISTASQALPALESNQEKQRREVIVSLTLAALPIKLDHLKFETITTTREDVL